MSIGEVTYVKGGSSLSSSSLIVMRKKRGPRSALLGLLLGFVGGFLLANFRLVVPLPGQGGNLTSSSVCGIRKGSGIRTNIVVDPLKIVKIPDGEDPTNGAKNLVFVGVMTARKYLDTRAKAVFETWGFELPGRIAFFSSDGSSPPENRPDLPLVALPNVDDSYPPQKKSFLMLKWMWQNFGDKFEWFLRADDDVYVRTDRLETLLRSVDSSLPRYIGQAGRGNSEEFGLLSLEYDENFCMGGPGVVLSRETLRRIVPHISYCLQNLYTTHEDVELGRCVQKYAGIPCTWSYEMQSILYHNSSGEQAFTGNLKRKEVHRAITLHPVKSPPYMYRLHNYMRGLRIQELQHLKVQLHRDIRSMMSELRIESDEVQNYNLAKSLPLFPDNFSSDRYLGDNLILGVPAGLRSYRPLNGSQVLPWDFLSRSEYSLLDQNPRRRIHTDAKEGLEDITREVMASINACSRQRGRVVEERSVLYGYRRVDSFGADTVLDLLLIYRKYRGRKVTLPVRRHVYVHQHFTGLEIREVSNGLEVEDKSIFKSIDDERKNTLTSVFRGGFLGLRFVKNLIEENNSSYELKTLHIILPLSGRLDTFRRFLRIYDEICLKTNEKTELIIVIFASSQISEMNSFNDSVTMVERIRRDRPEAKIDLLPTKGEFSRAAALEIGASRRRDEDLLFFVDVDIVFTREALRRIRLNTVSGRQIYFPVVFSQFDPRVVRKGGPDLEGYWREYGFGIVALYRADFRAIGGFDLSIKGWGKEDVDLFEKAVKSNLTVFRAPDPDLVHVFHDVECDPTLAGSQLSMCQGTRADTYAGTAQLAQVLYSRPEILRFAKGIREARISTPAA